MIQHTTDERPCARPTSDNLVMIDKLADIAYRLAYDAGPKGITVSDVRLEAFKKGILTGYETGRQLSYLGAVPAAAGLINTGQTRRSSLAVTHRVRQCVWVHPSHEDMDRGDCPYRF